MSAIPIYYVKVLGVADRNFLLQEDGGEIEIESYLLLESSGTVNLNLPVASVEFTETVFVPGQHRLGTFTLTLLNTRDQKHLRTIYNLLRRRLRVEIYENPDLLGIPVFSGVLIRETRDIQGNRQWTGNSYEDWLDRRHLRSYELLSGNATTVAESLLQTQNIVFSDDFNRVALGANWAESGTHLGGWTIVNNILTRGVVADTGADRTYLDSPSFSIAQWNDCKISFDVLLPEYPPSSGLYINFPYDGGLGTTLQASVYGTIERGFGWGLTDEAFALEFGRFVAASPAWIHVDIYQWMPDALTRRFVLVINGTVISEATSTWAVAAHAGKVRFLALGTQPFYIDNFIFATKTAVLIPGTVDASITTLAQQMAGDSNLAALEWICEEEGWEYRIRPRAGAGNDIIDIGTSVGINWDGYLALEDSKNIISLNADNTDEGFATQLLMRGQTSDESIADFVSVSIDAMDIYGIVEDEFSDGRAADSIISKLLGDTRLTRLSEDRISISGRIDDESYLLRQDPRWGYAVWGDAVWGGRDRFHAGDLIPLKGPDMNLDRSVEFVSITRRSGDRGIDVVFDAHPWRQSDDERVLRRQVRELQRMFELRMDTQPLTFELAGAGSLDLTLQLRGKLYKSIFVDVTSPAWGVNVTLTIDGNNVTNALFGSATINSDKSAIDTTYLTRIGAHTITIGSDGAVKLTVGIRPSLAG